MRFAAISFAQSLWFVLFSGCLLSLPLSALAGPYALSAHGNADPSGYGVLRTILEGSYVRGNCGHCHEQHTAVADGYLLIGDGFDDTRSSKPYVQESSVCFYCHALSTESSVQKNGIVNNSYSITFGNETVVNSSIFAAFNKTSYHNLKDIKTYITGGSGSKTFTSFPASSNPCSGCHNVHIARGNKRNIGDPAYTALSKPSDHSNLWGNDTSPDESMYIYGTSYQPPNRVGGNLEPDGVTNVKATQAAKTPNYAAFCTDCHSASNTINYSNSKLKNSLVSGTVLLIDWVSGGGDKHGSRSADIGISMNSPYSNTVGYVLSCCDCHEPHGSANVALIRTTVNGGLLRPLAAPPTGSFTDNSFTTTDWGALCDNCHYNGAMGSWKDVHHGKTASNDIPYPDTNDSPIKGNCNLYCHPGMGAQQIPCINCHFHGSSDDWLDGHLPSVKTGRRTF